MKKTGIVKDQRFMNHEMGAFHPESPKRLERIYARVWDPNIASYKLLEGAGFKREGRLRKALLQNKQWFDGLMYGLLREEYGNS